MFMVKRSIKQVLRLEFYALCFKNAEEFITISSVVTFCSKKSDKKGKPMTPEEILAGFNQLRQEQRNYATKLTEFECEVNEHNMVIETLKNVDPERKCHRLIGGILVETQVKDVLPAVVSNKENVEAIIVKFKEMLTKKGQELLEYKEKHHIRLRGEDDFKPTPDTITQSEEARGNVLVS